MKSISNALDRMLRQHEPFPAVVMDRYRNVWTANEAAQRFFNRFVDLDILAGTAGLPPLPPFAISLRLPSTVVPVAAEFARFVREALLRGS